MTDKIIDLPAMLSSLSAQDQLELIKKTIGRFIHDILNIPYETSLDRTATFSELGMDSITAVQLKSLIEESLGGRYEIESAAIFDYPSINELACHVASQLNVLE